MTSPKPVKVWSAIAEGTIDRRLESLLHEKGDSAELVLDGKLLGERTEEVNLAEPMEALIGSRPSATINAVVAGVGLNLLRFRQIHCR